MSTRDELAAVVKGEISHHISPVIGWLRLDAARGRTDAVGERLAAYRDRLDQAAEAIVKIIEEQK